MKLNLYLHHLQILAILILLLHFFSCKSTIELPDEHEKYIFENTTDKKKYFLTLDSIDDSYAEGRIYYIYKDLIMQPNKIQINLHKRKCVVQLYDSNVYTLKVKKKKKDSYVGFFTSNTLSRKKEFNIYPYQKTTYEIYNADRYKNKSFDVERIPNIEYAKVKGFWSSIPDDTIDVSNIIKTGIFNSLKKNDLNLDMDIYIPKDDTLSKRPLMMFIHGGAFFIGDKATQAYQKWCTHFASLGYVCVSINYRMGFRINSKAIERTAYQATQDAHAAMRYLISKKDVYRIDTDNLFVGGASAGSITALNLTYMRNKDRPQSSYSTLFLEDLGDLETSGNKIYNKFRIKAVANMWGSIYDLDILKNSNASIISFHGNEDVILPYGFGYPFKAIGEFQKVFFDKMYGSSYIHDKAIEIGIRSELHTFYGQGHALHLDENRNLNDNFYTIQNKIVDFFYDELIEHPAHIIQDKDDIQIFRIDTTEIVEANWCVVGGISIEESQGTIRASWFDDESNHELRVSGLYKNGAGFEDVLTIRNIKENEDNSHK